MGFVAGIIDWVVATLGPYGLAGLAALSATEAIFNPVPPDVLLVPMAIDQPGSWLWLGAVTAAASVAGAIVGWALGRWAAPLMTRFVSEAKLDRAYGIYERYGAPAIVVAAITPVPFKVFTISAGLMEYPVVPFITASAVGRSIRFLSVAGLAAWKGQEAVELVDRAGLWAVVALVLVVASYFVWAYRHKFGAGRREDA